MAVCDILTGLPLGQVERAEKAVLEAQGSGMLQNVTKANSNPPTRVPSL